MRKKKGIGGHQKTVGDTQTWLTPPHILRALGPFDLDPCAAVYQPWKTARKHYTEKDDGLSLPWEGRVWLNPPYNRYLIGQWLQRLADHGNGIALVFARTETAVFQQYVFSRADSILFLRNRLTFYTEAGVPGSFNGGAPSCLIAYGEENVSSLQDCGLEGKHLLVNRVPVIVVGVSPSWKSVIAIALVRLGKRAPVKAVYEMVETIAPDKTKKNRHYREKVRQQLRYHFVRVAKGEYVYEHS